MEKRLIDANALLDKIENWLCAVCETPMRGGSCGGCLVQAMSDTIEHSPTIDAVEVVRCKDCVHRGDYFECPMCGKFNDFTVYDGYCQHGSTTWDEDD
jgi:predicted RNA-binding Zn-ribbon protein involved in translation (DUF1610 family)